MLTSCLQVTHRHLSSLKYDLSEVADPIYALAVASPQVYFQIEGWLAVESSDYVHP